MGNLQETLEQESFSFKDRKGKDWDLALTFAACRRVDTADLSELTDKKFSILRPDRSFFTEVLTDPVLLCAIAWAIVKPQADQLGIGEEAFLDRLDGRTIQDLRTTLWRALAGFFPDQKTVLLTLAEQLHKAEGMIEKELQTLTGDLEVVIRDEVKTELERIKREVRRPHGGKSSK